MDADEQKIIEEILAFWFEGCSEHAAAPPDRMKLWWSKDDKVDRYIEQTFGAELQAASRGERDHWQQTSARTLALVVLLDQFSRNAYRDSARAWAQDERALAVTLSALERGFEKELGTLQRLFLLMPLMHAEDLAMQERCIAELERLADECPAVHRAYMGNTLDFAFKHRDIVARFGHFPHRNRFLGRASTEEEVAFLKQPGSSF